MSGPMTLATATILCNTRLLALCVWRESRGEVWEAQLAVAWSVINRVQRPKWWGKDVESVVWKKWQYSSMTDPNDPQLHLEPKLPDPSWLSCLGAAYTALFPVNDEVAQFPGADSYYDISMDDAGKPPFWIATALFCGQIGRLKFFDVDHDYEAPTTGHTVTA